jgi:hypothetical protein
MTPQRPGLLRGGERRVVEQRAVVDALALTALGGLKPGAHALGAVDQRVDLGQPASGELAQALGHRVGTVLDELADLLQRQAGALGDVDHRQAPQYRLVVAALAADALWFGQQPDLLVLADQRHPHAGSTGDLPDAHLRFVHAGLDLKST